MVCGSKTRGGPEGSPPPLSWVPSCKGGWRAQAPPDAALQPRRAEAARRNHHAHNQQMRRSGSPTTGEALLPRVPRETRGGGAHRVSRETPRTRRCAAAASPRAARPGGGNTGKRRGGDASHDAAAKRGYAAYHSRGMWWARRLRAWRRRKGSEVAAKAACPGLWPVPQRIGCDTVRHCSSRTQRRTPPRRSTKPKGGLYRPCP